jgi:hypothetical protein
MYSHVSVLSILVARLGVRFTAATLLSVGLMSTASADIYIGFLHTASLNGSASSTGASGSSTSLATSPIAKFTAQDCAVWKGGEIYQNESVPSELSSKVELILDFLHNLPLSEALAAIEIYCNSSLEVGSSK